MAEYNSSYTGAQIDSAVAKAHSHTGNITESGTLQTTDVTIADGDKLVVTDASDSNKVARASISFNGTTTTKALTQKGTFETFARPSDLPTTMVASGTGHAGGLVPDPPETAGTLKYLREDGTWSEPDNIICVTIPSAPTSATTSYTKDEKTEAFAIGQFARVADVSKDSGYAFYQLCDLQSDGTVAVWKEMTYEGGSNGKIIVSISAFAFTETVPSSQLGNVVVTCTKLDDGSSQSVTWTGSDVTFANLLPIKDYRISVEDRTGWVVENPTINITIGEERNVNIVYHKVGYAYIKIDQTKSDETQMITVSETVGGAKQTLDATTGKHANAALQALRDASHLYMGKASNGKMALRQLKDDDGTKYADDDSTAAMDGSDGDHYLRIDVPFFIKRVSGSDSGDQVIYGIVVGGQPDSTWKQIITPDDLLAVHEATATDTTNNTSGTLRSISGGQSTGSISQANFKQKARNGGTGFSLVTWEWHNIMALLFYAWYGRTNAQAQCGTGANSYTRTLGTKDSLGMTDTTSSNGNTDNTKFWGIENWWGDKYEWVDNVVVDARVWKVTDKEGTQRTAGTGASSDGEIQKMLFSENLDLIPTTITSNSSYNTYYCDYYGQSPDSSRVVLRSDHNADAYGGVACVMRTAVPRARMRASGSRVAFNGTIVEASVMKLRFRTANESAVTGAPVTVTTPTGTETHVTDANGEITVMTLPGTCALSCLTHDLNISQFTATSGQYTVDIVATEKPLETGYIILDQTSSDPTTKVIDESGHTYASYQRPAVIDAIRAASHCYVGTFANNKMSLKQLSDTDGTLYADGTSASTDITTTGKDVFMRLPFFFTRVSGYATDKIKIEFAFDPAQTATSTRQPDGSGWKQWGGNDLIGKYEAYETNNMTYSKSGVDSTGNVSQANMKSHARARGTGFTLVKWRHQNIMAILFYAYYGHTNCQTLIGSGANAYNGSTRYTGLKNSLGMTDTTSANGNTDNIVFWGLENWWGCKYEWVDNVVIDNHTWTITEDDGTTRTIQSSAMASGNGTWIYPSKFILGDNLDVIAAAGQSGGSDSQGYCDGQYYTSSSSRVVRRSCGYADAGGGVACVFAGNDSSYTHASGGSRVAYTGTIEIV